MTVGSWERKQRIVAQSLSIAEAGEDLSLWPTFTLHHPLCQYALLLSRSHCANVDVARVAADFSRYVFCSQVLGC